MAKIQFFCSEATKAKNIHVSCLRSMQGGQNHDPLGTDTMTSQRQNKCRTHRENLPTHSPRNARCRSSYRRRCYPCHHSQTGADRAALALKSCDLAMSWSSSSKERKREAAVEYIVLSISSSICLSRAFLSHGLGYQKKARP